jgi:DNA topoisomerase-1
MGTVYGSLDRDDDVLAIGMNRAVELLAKKLAGVRALGAHPKDGQPVAVKRGRFGPYIQHGSVVANVPRGTALEDVTLDEAVALLAERGKPLKAKGKKAGGKTSGTTNGRAAAKAGAGETAPAAAPPSAPAASKQAAKKAAPDAAAKGKAGSGKQAAKKPAKKPGARAPTAAKAPARRTAGGN